MIQRQWQTHPTDDRFTNWQTFLFYYCKCKKDKKFNLWFYFCLLLYDCTTSRHTLFLCLKKATCFYYTLAFSLQFSNAENLFVRRKIKIIASTLPYLLQLFFWQLI